MLTIACVQKSHRKLQSRELVAFAQHVRLEVLSWESSLATDVKSW